MADRRGEPALRRFLEGVRDSDAAAH